MIEKCARAAAKAFHEGQVGDWETPVRAVITELMDPSDATLEQASLLFKKAWWGAPNNSRRDAWQAALRAILDERE